MIETILTTLMGGAGGALLRLLPEGLGLVKTWMAQRTAREDRAHELSIMDKQITMQKELQSQRLEEIRTLTDGQAELLRMQGAIEAMKPTGIFAVDLLNGLVRPIVTYWFFGIYAAYKTAGIWTGGFIWNDTDMATFNGILTFWFLDRQMGKAKAGK